MRTRVFGYFVLLLLTIGICSSGVFAQAGYIKGTVITNAGEDDPSFSITDPNDIQTMQNMLANLPPASDPQWPQFGSRGYALHNQGIASFPADLHVFQGVIQIFTDTGSSFFVDQNGLEAFLGQKSGFTKAQLAVQQMLSDNNALPSSGSSTAAFTEIAVTDNPAPAPSPTPQQPPPPPQPLPTSGAEPPYQPGNWNAAGVIANNNCYAYATNVMGNAFPRPGRAGGQQPPFPGQAGYNCANFIAAAVSDGLVQANCNNACPAGSFKVALVLNPNTDYHWYRQDNNGNWSHKPGGGPATNLDNSRNPIVDPRTADRGPYTTFCSCFCVNPARINIR